jgi:oligopeptide transport system ATP-binding protein
MAEGGSAGATLLEVRDLRVRFSTDDGVVEAVDGVSFSLARGETLAVVGESGSGKSVTALALMRLIAQPPGHIAGGEVLLDGRDLLKVSEHDMRAVRGNDVAMVFQDPMTALNPVFTIGFQMMEPLRLHQKLSRSQASSRAAELLSQVGIGDGARRLHDYPHQFSGGQRQRIMIAMALACNPSVLIADEPTTALDVTVQAQILDLMQELQSDFGSGIILITHDLGIVARTANRVAVMYAGRLVEHASTEEIFAKPHHPYTWGLIDSIPRLDSAQGEKLIPIPGSPPSLIQKPPGCAFHPRCRSRRPVCHTEVPPLRPVADDHLAACVLTAEEVTAERVRVEGAVTGELIAEKSLETQFGAGVP